MAQWEDEVSVLEHFTLGRALPNTPGVMSLLATGANIKDSSRWVVTLIRGLYKPHIGPLPLYEPYMSLIWGTHLVTTHLKLSLITCFKA